MGDRGVGDAVVDPAEPGSHVGHKPAEGVAVGGVEPGRQQLIGMGRREGVEFGGARAGEGRHAIAAAEQVLHDREPEPAGASGDDADRRKWHGGHDSRNGGRPRSEPEPDLAVVAGSPADYRLAHPATVRLVVEVAIATLGIDRAKADVYAAAGIDEYWIVIPESHSVEICRQPSAAGYGSRVVVSDPAAVIEAASMPAASLRVDWLFG